MRGQSLEVATFRRTLDDFAVLGRQAGDRLLDVTHRREVLIQTDLVGLAQAVLQHGGVAAHRV